MRQAADGSRRGGLRCQAAVICGVMPDEDVQLRTRLQEITETHSFEHIERVERLREDHAHTVEPLRDNRGRPLSPFGTCFAFALGLHEDPTYHYIATCDAAQRHERFFASSIFVCWLVDRGKIEVRDQNSPAESDLILYFINGSGPVHAGIGLEGGRVRSKWGTGLVWEHALWEVPASYGNHFRSYMRPSVNEMREAFLEWLGEQPGITEFATTHGFLNEIGAGAGDTQ